MINYITYRKHYITYVKEEDNSSDCIFMNVIKQSINLKLLTINYRKIFKNSKNNKSAGTEGILIELFKAVGSNCVKNLE